jgi:phosphoribosyl 1,2-cyclic phosphate phosphodiesterase
MKLTFLGTGTSQGVPLIGCKCHVCSSLDPHDKRLRTSVMFTDDKRNVVIDTGPDFRQQMLREHVSAIECVLFTHEHKDHLAGLDDVRAFNFIMQKSMDVYATQRVQEAIKREFRYIFDNSDYPGIPKINLKPIGTSPFIAGGINFTPIEVMHYKLPVLGFRAGDITYITDANLIPEGEKEKIYGSKVLVLNALRKQAHVSHFTLDEAIKVVEELKPGMAYFTHLSHQMGTHAEVEAELPPNIRLAYDGLVVSDKA